MKLVFATNNTHKLEEINKVIVETEHEIVSLSDIQCYDDIPEEQDILKINMVLIVLLMIQGLRLKH